MSGSNWNPLDALADLIEGNIFDDDVLPAAPEGVKNADGSLPKEAAKPASGGSGKPGKDPLTGLFTPTAKPDKPTDGTPAPETAGGEKP